MITNIYVDGSGGAKSGYGFFVKETGESLFTEKLGLTNNQAEYLAIISALQKYANSDDEIVIYSDSKNTVNQLNHEFAINNENYAIWRERHGQSWQNSQISKLFGYQELRIWLEKCWAVSYE